MKKRMRKLNCLLLVALLVACTVVPAMAAYVTDFQGTGTKNGYSYSVTMYHNDDYGIAYIGNTGTPTTLKASAKSYIYDELNDLYGYSAPAHGTGFATASAQSNNVFWHDNYYFDGVVVTAHGQLYVGNALVVSTFPEDD